jgi:putative acetyltransferase
MLIRRDDLTGPEIAELLRQHLATMALHSPPESIHALDLAALRVPEITFWTVWEGTDLLGCGALKELDLRHGEIKSMHTAAQHRRCGVGDAIVSHIVSAARSLGMKRLSLETGSADFFMPARKLYEKHGFAVCAPFADYVEDPNSVYMTLEVTGR